MPRNARRPPAAPAAALRGIGQVRIIGGRWRGTKLAVPERPGLRPSSDRVRETLFNWLMPALPGARVLDLFAGTGVLGLEALSRGAARAVLVERDPGLATALREVVAKLSAPAEVHAADALAWLGGRHEAFDLVFLDPPFADALWGRALEALVPRLAPGAWIYVESPADIVPAVPPAWALHREGRTREVRYALYRAPGHHAAVTLRPDDPPATTE
ncbi:16S rRNA (guanine(966)-N(2))-methyltransferase RsmD [Pseudoxanthomonas sp. Root65]|uniref:16S rRNA (guanine(966)-N(2))-methyltransferase RsmD n=1 Tax=Pseudoxanthomonas sp. Root65 TaxID=1736576 RepID=UPI0006FBF02D|nr:16S rRNA (guanine(966)-N(2))-methyltransferase RsmD [Pseudoxanthomonas sp. Root65]KRA53284.1 16S rRNA (guanine(966)-N(2))-methyltransferase RsmD [Pseudoxanthomonas sp. Root65]